MIFVKDGQRIATENFVSGKVYNILFKNDVNTNMMCTSIGSDCVIFQGQAPLGLFTLTIQNADTVDTIEEAQAGTTNYNNLINKPSINSVDLIGNKSLSDLGIQEELSSSQLDAVNSGITSADVTQIGTNENNILSEQSKTTGMSEGGTNYITVNGIRVYVSSTAPTGARTGDLWIGG